MKKEYSPFTPGVPVPIEFFVGRADEIQRFVSTVRKSIELKTIERLFVFGERGIGKSSLCNYALSITEKNQNVIGLHVLLGGVSTLEEMVRRIFNRLLQESIDKPWYDNIKKFLGNHIKQLDLFGMTVEFSASNKQLLRAVNDFVPALRNLLKKLPEEKRGLIIILDDINGLALKGSFANWIKSLVDDIATSRTQIPLTLVLVGITERRYQLVNAQPSLDRVFDLIEIQKFNELETKEFYKRTFNKVNVSIENKALDSLWHTSGGYPVFMHELGDAVFNSDDDKHIDIHDANRGIIKGIRIIGAKYIEPKVLSYIQSEKYKNILNKISRTDTISFSFKRQEIITKLNSEEVKVFDNFIRKMENLNVIIKDKEHGRGAYRFSSELYFLFFLIQAVHKEQ